MIPSIPVALEQARIDERERIVRIIDDERRVWPPFGEGAAARHALDIVRGRIDESQVSSPTEKKP